MRVMLTFTCRKSARVKFHYHEVINGDLLSETVILELLLASYNTHMYKCSIFS